MTRGPGSTVRRKKSHAAMTAASDSGATAPPLSLPEFSSPVMDEGHFSGAPPSPSTLTDIILSLHASLYGAKRSVEEIREMVWRYYDNRAGTCGLLPRRI